MAAGDLITQDWEAEFRGLLMGPDTAYEIQGIEGLLSLPDVSSSDQGRLRRHGQRAGDDFLQGRTVTITLEVFGADTQAFALAIDRLDQALRPCVTEEPLVFQVPTVALGAKIQVGARVRRSDIPVDTVFFYNRQTITVEFDCTDPRRYSNTVNTASSSLPSDTGGLTFDADPDFSFGLATSGGGLSAPNAGSFPTPVTFRIDGPVTSPNIVNNATSARLHLKGLTLLTGQWIILDSESRTVLLNGTADRYFYLTSDSTWWDLEPGSNSMSYAASASTTSTLAATWRSAWV